VLWYAWTEPASIGGEVTTGQHLTKFRTTRQGVWRVVQTKGRERMPELVTTARRFVSLLLALLAVMPASMTAIAQDASPVASPVPRRSTWRRWRSRPTIWPTTVSRNS